MEKIKYIRLLLEWGTYPVWLYDDEGGVIDTVLPEELQGNAELEAIFDDLQDRYNALFIADEHEFSYKGFASQEEKELFLKDLNIARDKFISACEGKYDIINDLVLYDELDLEDDACPWCHCRTESFCEDSVMGIRCTNCEWCIVTTYIEPIRADTTLYTLSIDKIDNADLDQLRTVSKLLGVNYLEARKLLQNGDAKLVDQAVEIQKYKMLLNSKNITFNIYPDFQY